MSDASISHPAGFGRSLRRILSCIRFDEVLALQGAPLIGAILSIEALSPGGILRGTALVVGNSLLVTHVFALNDLGGIHGDVRDPNRTARTFAAKGVSQAQIGSLTIGLLALSLLIFGILGLAPFFLAAVIVSLSALYSAPGVHMKGRPIACSVLHVVGGTLHFLLGYATFRPINAQEIVVGLFFGLVFAAGHLMHETRDYDGDLLNRIQTNAVTFGKTRSFAAGLVLFTAAYALLVALALSHVLPQLLVLAGAMYAVQLHVSLRVLHSGLTYRGILYLQKCYRLLFALIGVMMVGPAVFGLIAGR